MLVIINILACFCFRFGDWELPGEGEKETPIQKHERLQCELKELFDEINQLKEKASDDAEQKSMVEILSQVETMGKQLNGLKLNETLGADLVASLADPQGASLKWVRSILISRIYTVKKNACELPPKTAEIVL